MALRDCRLPAEVTGPLQRHAAAASVRPLLIRRHHRRSSGQITVFGAFAHPERPWMQTGRLEDPAALLDLDLKSLGEGRSMGLDDTDDPLFLVCTHGKHDACCAERGRPVASALTEVEPEATWEVSHIGGDRFAGNVLVLRDGLYYGRVSPTGASGLAATHRAGRIDLGHLRGRSGFPFAVQAAEWFLRHELRADGASDLQLLGRRTGEGLIDVDFRVHNEQVWRVRVRLSRSAPQRLTCSASNESQIPRFDLVTLHQVELG
jgi:hypothetical protein